LRKVNLNKVQSIQLPTYNVPLNMSKLTESTEQAGLI